MTEARCGATSRVLLLVPGRTGLLHALAGAVIALLIPRRRRAEVRGHGPCGRRTVNEGVGSPSR